MKISYYIHVLFFLFIIKILNKINDIIKFKKLNIMELISVIMPYYNNFEFVEKSVNSVLSQTYKKI